METQDITAIASVFIATLAVFATYWQARLTRIHNKKSTTPILTVHRSERKGYEINVKNEGVGPAIITNFNYYIDDEKIPNIEYFDKKLAVSIPVEYFRAEVKPPSPIGVGQSLQILVLSGDQKFEDNMIDIGKRVRVEINYKSVYDETYQT